MTELKVDLGNRAYEIAIGENVFNQAIKTFESLKKEGRKIVCVADKKMLSLNLEKMDCLKSVVDVIELDGGEDTKCFSMLEFLCSEFALRNLNRKSLVIAFGGGVIGDLVGFAASVYMRGIDFYQVPTTLLAMVDSSVGGKTGINIKAGKNLVGAFHQPLKVFEDISFLKTLPSREFAAGMAEVIKCAILGDKSLFDFLESQPVALSPQTPAIVEAIKQSCALKARIVAQDEREMASGGGRALLNFGHTFGHAIEHCAGYGTYLHGEAVAMGMVMASMLSQKLGYISDSDVERIKNIIISNNLPIRLSEKFSEDEMIEAMSHDKKNVSNKLRFVIVKSIGESFTSEIETPIIRSVLTEFMQS